MGVVEIAWDRGMQAFSGEACDCMCTLPYMCKSV